MPAASVVSEHEFLLLILCLLNEIIDFFFLMIKVIQAY